ncbi:DUF397 domain-containing protein [Actinomadura rupiterrae]|uniref:DUF397 domain-containing protein n=1 Tax=Actinomadura rupiterrae TaxID=559627 RepID=UPI0020A2B61F|nr:DUF397 domain-containing protein [Actinomadura rupiterrae]MCP2336204.1 hypothetical protein [Actinomadura rupiterrae]
MNAYAASRTIWRKSSYSSAEHSDCVELSDLGAAVSVRDSKDPHGPKLAVASADWRALTDAIKRRPFA